MGNGNSTSKNFFNDIIPIDTFIHETNPNICQKYEKEGEGINEAEFSTLLKLKKSPEFNHGIFNIFENSNGKIPMKNFKGFYYMLKSNDKSTLEYKKKFVTNLLFNSQNEISEEAYVQNALLYFAKEPQLRYLFGKKLKEKIRSPKNATIFNKNFFIENIDLIDNCFFNSLHVREERNTSLNNDEFNNDIIYICHCSEEHKEEIAQPEIEKKYHESFNRMKGKFSEIEKEFKTFSIKKLGSFLEEVGTERIIIKIISRYLSKRTRNNFLSFDIFKEIFMRISKTKNEEEQIDLILSFLSFPNEDGNLDKETVAFLLKESNFKGELEKSLINKEELLFFLKNASDLNLIKIVDSIPISLDKISVLPFIKFGAIPFEPFHFRNIKNFILKKTTIEKLIKDSILEEEEFCVIDGFFMKKMLAFIENNNSSIQVPSIDLLKVSDEMNCLKQNLSYPKDFFFCPKKIYDDYISNWFPKKGNDIILYKVTYEREGNYKEEEYGDNIIINKEGKIEEVEFYPVVVKYISFRDIYYAKTLTREPINQTTLFRALEKLYYDKKCLSTQTLKFSRKTKLKTVFRTIEERIDLSLYKHRKFHIYYNSRLSTDEINQFTTFEEQKIKNLCFVIINSVKTIDPINITFLQEFQVELEILLPESPIVCFTEKSDSIMGVPSRTFSRISSLYIKKISELKIFGLNNIGNSCYLNSVLQILLNLSYIKEIFSHSNLKFFTKRVGKSSNKGVLVEQFSELIKVRFNHSNNNQDSQKQKNSVTPKVFKEICGLINKTYANLEQQDANEFLYFLLNELHEELNINYMDNDDIFKNKEDININKLSEEKLSSLYWAEYIRKAPSFINALFSLQFKTILKCTQCNKTKTSFENSKGLFLPIPMGKNINLNIIIQKLPYNFKIYYDKINEHFKNFCELNQSNSKLVNLELFQSSKEEDEKDTAMTYPNLIKMEMLFNKLATVGDLIEIVKNQKELELEPTIENLINNSHQNDIGIEKREIINYTTILCGILDVSGFDIDNFKILTNDMIIDECFQENQNVYLIEVLNSNGINEIQGISKKNMKYTLSNYILKEKNKKIFDSIIKKTLRGEKVKKEEKEEEKKDIIEEEISTSKKSLKDEVSPSVHIDILSLDNYLSYYDTATSISEVVDHNQIDHIEYHIMIKHCFQNLYQYYYFDRYERKMLFFPFDAIIVNNTENNFIGKTLYDLIWNKYKRFIKEPMKTEKNLWWRNKEQSKFCYPFVIKLCKNEGDNSQCSTCLWFKFCKGCIINPFDTTAIKVDLNNIIMVEWCKEVTKNELILNQIKTMLEIKMEDNNKSYMEKELNIEDLFNQIIKGETLENEIDCDNCKEKRIFQKNIQFDIMPPVLIVTLKRFQYEKMFKRKIESFVKFPLINLRVNGSVYDLHGVINHQGTINGGHYTTTVKINNRWIYFDDSQFEEIPENQVESKKAYILVYVLQKEDLNSNNWKEQGKENLNEGEEKEFDKVDVNIPPQMENDDQKEIVLDDDIVSQDNQRIEKEIILNDNDLIEKGSFCTQNSIGVPKKTELYRIIMKTLSDNVVIKEAENTLNTVGKFKYYYPKKIIGEPIFVLNENNEKVYGYISNIMGNKIEVTTFEEVKSYPSDEVGFTITLTVAGIQKMKDLYKINDDNEDFNNNDNENNGSEPRKTETMSSLDKSQNKCSIF